MSVDQEPNGETVQYGAGWATIVILLVVLIAAIVVGWVVYSSHTRVPDVGPGSIPAASSPAHQ